MPRSSQFYRDERALTDSYAYDAFGNLLSQSGSTPNVYLYRGERWDADLSLYYLRARWYNPATGGFMSRDPYGGNLWDPSTQHRYKYARSNPVNYIDPSGRGALLELGLDLGGKAAEAAAITYYAHQVRCLYRLDAAMLNALAQTMAAHEIIVSAVPDFNNCVENVTVRQLAVDTLIGVGTGLVFNAAIGGALEWAAGGAEEAEGGATVCGLCFAAGTPVKTENGEVPIERIKPGDRVWAHNTATGADELRTVTAVAPQHRDKLVELRIASEKNALRATPVHPFRARRNASDVAHWIATADLRPGDLIETFQGDWRKIEAVTPLVGLETVYNFTVANDHDYFVGQTGFLVHNAGGCGCNYRKTFFKAFPNLIGQVWVHHAIPQAVLNNYPGLFTPSEINDLGNLRGIPNGVNNDLHLSKINRIWNQFYRDNPNATRDAIEQKAKDIDQECGSQFLPPI